MMGATHCFCPIFILLALARPLQAEPKVVWQIGELDGSGDELAVARSGPEAYTRAFPNDVTFEVGTDAPSRDWPSIQPGPSDAWAGSKTHPFTIVFAIPDKPAAREAGTNGTPNAEHRTGHYPVLQPAGGRIGLLPGGKTDAFGNLKAWRTEGP